MIISLYMKTVCKLAVLLSVKITVYSKYFLSFFYLISVILGF